MIEYCLVRPYIPVSSFRVPEGVGISLKLSYMCHYSRPLVGIRPRWVPPSAFLVWLLDLSFQYYAYTY